MNDLAADILACPACDMLQRLPPLPAGGKAVCPQCGQTVATRPSDPLNRPLALVIAAAIVFIIANTSPLMSLSAAGRHSSTTILGGAYEMWVQQHELTAAVVAFCVVVAPAVYILFMATVLIAVRRPPAPHWVGELLRWAAFMSPWSMNEVMMLGVLVALIKIAELATVIPGVGMYAVGLLIALLPAIALSCDLREIWSRIGWVDERPPNATFIAPRPK